MGFFFFLNVNFIFTLVLASRHIRFFLVPSSARVTQRGDIIPCGKREAVADGTAWSKDLILSLKPKF